jgi:hypothetical protein
LNQEQGQCAEQGRADNDCGELELERQNSKRQQVEFDHVDLEIRVDHVEDPQDDDTGDNELRAL